MASRRSKIDIDLDYSKIKYEKINRDDSNKLVDYQKIGAESNGSLQITDSGKKKHSASNYDKDSYNEKVTRTKVKKQSILGTVIVCMILAVLLVMMVQGRVELNKSSKELAELRKNITRLESERNVLNSKIDASVDMIELEKYVKSNGMISSNDIEKKYIGKNVTDDVDVFENEEGFFDISFSTILSAISQSFLKTWNNLRGEQ